MYENQEQSGTFIWAVVLQKIVRKKVEGERQQIHDNETGVVRR
jgi:hypothetical protein